MPARRGNVIRALLGPAVVPVGYCSVWPGVILWQNRHDRVMKYKLPNLLVWSVLAITLLHPAFAQEPIKRSSYTRSNNQTGPASESRAGEEGPEPLAPRPHNEMDGNQLVAAAAREVFRQKGIQAKVRQRVTAFGQEVAGAGEYFQFGSGEQKLLRLELKMQVGSQTASLLQVCSRQDFWIRREVPPAAPRLEHVNLTRLRSAVSRLDDEGQRIPSENWIILGGLSRLVESLHQSFDFAPPQDGHIGTLSVHLLRGEIKPERLAELQRQSAGKTKGVESFAEQLPTAVVLSLGRAAEPFPHFPYRVEYLRGLSEKKPPAAASLEQGKENRTEVPLSLLEFYDVRLPSDLDMRMFEFDPGDEESVDRTQTWLRRLQE